MKRTVADRTRKKTLTRRQWLSAGAGTLAASAAAPLLTGGASLEGATAAAPAGAAQSGTRKVPMTLSCWDYDRTRALMDGRVQVEGVDLTYLPLVIEETFFRQARFREFDASEMSLSSYTVSLTRDNPAFIAIPIFPSRMFRHSNIWVNTKSGIRTPKDLIGKRVGMPEFQLTALVWIRGFLKDDHGVPVESVTYWTGGLEDAGRIEKIDLGLPPSIKVDTIDETKTLSQMLDAGEIDALYSPRAPSSFLKGSPNVTRLFPDYPEQERVYYQKYKIFPIMHTVVIRRSLYQQHPWIAQNLYKAFVESQRIAYAELNELAALKTMLPWLPQHIEDTKKVMGDDFWPYGLDKNMPTLTRFLQYHYEQGLSKRLLTPKELFAPESLERFKI
jgi:4,5-dihydroxyphthalate decarboxylase